MMNGYNTPMPPEMMQAVMNTGENDPEAVLLKQRQARADRMMNAGMAGGVPQGHMAGRVYIPPIGDAMFKAASMYKAGQMQPGLDAATQDAMGRTNNARNAYVTRLIEALRRPPPPQRPPLGGMPGPDIGMMDDRGGGY